MDGHLFLDIPWAYAAISGNKSGFIYSGIVTWVIMSLLFEFKRYLRKKNNLKEEATKFQRNFVYFGIPIFVIVMSHVFLLYFVTQPDFYFSDRRLYITLATTAIVLTFWDMWVMPLLFSVFRC